MGITLSDLNMQVQRWTTPQAHDTNKRSKGQTSGKLNNGAGNACLATDAEKFSHPVPVISTDGIELSETESTTSDRRRLNPAFVCWLMGWPWWWTQAAPISFAAQEMALWRSKLLQALLNLLDG